jgi:tetratricopeptide (TPR) repeat protein
MVEPPGTAIDDEGFLDQVFDRVMDRIEEGLPLDVRELLAGRFHLRDQIEELVRVAQQIAVAQTQSLPTVPGYTLLSEIGRGGMGAVYLARQERLGGRPVALKVLPPSVALSSEARERFWAEANAIARLRHTNIVSIYDVVREGGVYAYAMEWVDGKSLADLLGHLKNVRGKPNVQDVREFLHAAPGTIEHSTLEVFACRIGVAVARALGVVHRGDLLHRDVKPSNILIRRDGVPLLSDFGLAREAESVMHTQTGRFVGTPAYAAPEQLRGRPDDLDARTDVYGLGVTLYHALCLRVPFQGKATTEILNQIEAGRARPPRRINPRIPRDLQTIVATAMDPDPQRRYASADALADDLERLLNLQPIEARPAGLATRAMKFARRKRGALFGAVVGGMASLMLAVAFVVYWFFVPGWVKAHVDNAHLALLDASALDRVYMAASRGRSFAFPTVRPRLPEGVADAALSEYEPALRLDPTNRALRLERDIVSLARDLSVHAFWRTAHPDRRERLRVARFGLGGEVRLPAAVEKHTPLAADYARGLIATSRPPPLEDDWFRDASVVDLRSLGLLAFLCQDVETSLRAWTQLDLLQDPDPLVEASLGQLYIALDQPARAYPRLRNAFRTYHNSGALCVSLADAALQCGDVQKAESLLNRAPEMQRLDSTCGLERVEADLYAATDREHLARERYEWLRQEGGNFVALYNYARFLEARGELQEAVRVYQEWVRDPRKVAKLERAFVAATQRWWDLLPADERWKLLRGTLDEDPAQPDAFVKLLRDYRASAAFLTRLRTRGMGGQCENPEATGEIAALGVNDLSPFLRGASLSAVVNRMGLADMLQWARFRTYPSLLKDLRVSAWLAPEPAEAGCVVDRLHKLWMTLSRCRRTQNDEVTWATPGARALAGKVQITVPSGFAVDLLAAGFDGPSPRLEAIRDADYGTGVMAALVDEGTVYVYRVSESAVELFAAGRGFPRPSSRRNVRFDPTGHFGGQLHITVSYAPPGEPEPAVWITTAILRVSETGEIAHVGSYGSLDEPLTLEFEFSSGAGGYAPGAFLPDLFRTFDGNAGLYHLDCAGNLTRLVQNLVPPGRTKLDVWAVEFDPTGRYGSYLTMADSDTAVDYVAAVYQLRPDLTWIELTAPVSTDKRFYSDLAFSVGGSFGEKLYVAECVQGEIIRVLPNGEDEPFASGFEFRTSEGWNIGSITVSDDGEHMYVSDAKGIYHIHSLTAGDKPEVPAAAD